MWLLTERSRCGRPLWRNLPPNSLAPVSNRNRSFRAMGWRSRTLLVAGKTRAQAPFVAELDANALERNHVSMAGPLQAGRRIVACATVAVDATGNRGSGISEALPAWHGRRNPGLQSERRTRLLEPPPGIESGVPGARAGDKSAAFSADRGPGVRSGREGCSLRVATKTSSLFEEKIIIPMTWRRHRKRPFPRRAAAAGIHHRRPGRRAAGDRSGTRSMERPEAPACDIYHAVLEQHEIEAT